MYWEEEGGDLLVLQFAWDSQKVGGETVVQSLSWVLVQAAHAAVGEPDAGGVPPD